MANVKNFGLIGVGSDLQFGKAGTRILNNAGTFNFRNAGNSADAALTAGGITSSGNVALTTGNLSLDAAGGIVSIGGTNVLQRSGTGLPQISGTAGLVMPTGTTAQRGTATLGQMRVNNDTENAAFVEFYDGDGWITLASGGNTALLQTEIDNIETSLGAGITTSGTFNAAAFTGAGLGSVTSFTDAINTVANAAAAKDTLDEIFPSTANGNVIYSSGGVWAQAAPGATSGVQAYDAGLAALASKTSTGIMVQTGDDAYASRSLVAPAAGITINNADGVSGNPTFALANDLAAVEGLATTGYAVRTGDGTWTTRSIDGTAGNIVVTNVDGVASNTNINLAEVTQVASGNFVKVTLDGFGRVTGNTAVVASDITTLVDGTYVNISGDTMTGNLDFGGTAKVTGLAAPTVSGDAVNKAYVDSLIDGLTWKNAVAVATTASITLSGLQTIDGYAVQAGDRVLVKDQSPSSANGIYVAAAGAWARSSDMDAASEFYHAAVFVTNGTTQANTGWTETSVVTTLGTDPVVWQQFSGSNTYIAGTGLSLSGNTFNVNLGAGIAELPGDEIGVDVASNLALQLTSSLTGGQLTFVLAAGSGLSQSSSGLTIAAGGVTNAMLANSGFVINADAGGTDTVSLGETLLIAGNSVQGITTNRSGDNTITISASDASSSQKGVASFTTSEFVVTSGNVALGTVPTAKLQNNSITFTGDTGSDAVVLGESFDFNGDSTLITTAVSANAVSFTLGTVDVAHGGTGLTTLEAGQLLIGNGTSAVSQDADLAFNAGTNTLTVGSATIAGAAGGDVTITATGTNGDINLVPNGTGQVVIGPAGAGVIASDAGATLTVTGATGLTLGATAGDVTVSLAANATDKVTVTGPTAAQYASNLADADLVNKKYVDDAIQSGAASGSIKAVKATVNLGTNGATNIGAALPAGATVVRVKVQVTSADTGTGTLSVGVGGDVARYMTTGENDTQSTGLYLAETYYVNGGSEQVVATVAGGSASGSAVVFVEYQVA